MSYKISKFLKWANSGNIYFRESIVKELKRLNFDEDVYNHFNSHRFVRWYSAEIIVELINIYTVKINKLTRELSKNLQ